MEGLSRILTLTDEKYVSFVAEFVDGLDPATRAHLAVAYQNLMPTLSGAARAYRSRNIPFSVEIFIQELERDLPSPDEEINYRRLSWFLMSAIVARLEKISKANPDIVSTGAVIWTIILTEYPRLKVLLPNNVVWTASEKEWFDLTQPDNVLIERGMNYDVPLIFAKSPAMADFAKRMGLFYHPMDDRSGMFVP